ncbi:MAG: hypothetical protein AB7G23_19220 [Vicinamibacterales bacterium]
MTTPIAGIRIVVETAEGVKNFQDIQRAALATPAAFRVATQSAASYGATVNQVMNLAASSTAKAAGAAAQAARQASPELKKLESAFQAAALAAAEVPGPIGQVLKAVSGFALGGGIAGIAVVGIAAFVALFRDLRAAAEEADQPLKAMQDRIENLRQARLDRSGELLEKDILASRQAATEAADLVAKLQASATELLKSIGYVPQRLRNSIADALRTQLENQRGLTELETERNRRREEEAKREAARLKREQEAAARLAEERRRQVEDVAVAEREAAAASAGSLQEEQRLRREIAEIQIQRTVRGMDQLSRTEQTRLRQALQLTQLAREQAEAAERAAKAEAARADRLRDFLRDNAALLDRLRDNLQTDLFKGRPVTVDRPGNAGAPFDPNAELEAGRERARLEQQLAGAYTESARAAVDLATALGLFDERAGQALTGVIDIVEAIDQIRRATRAAGSSAANSDLERVLGVAAQLPGLLGGVGAIVAGIGGLLGGGEADRVARAKADFAESLQHFEAIGDAFSELDRTLQSIRSSLGDAAVKAFEIGGFTVTGGAAALDTPEEIRAAIASLRQLADASSRFRDEASASIAALNELLKAYEANAAQARAQAELEVRRYTEDLGVRRLAAEGRDAEAEALRRQLGYERELADLKARFGDLFTDEIEAELRRTQALEAERDALRAATEEAQRRADIAATLTQRELAARQALGEDTAAQLREAEKAAELEAARRQGYSEAELARLAYIQGLEDEGAALARTAAAQREAAELAARRTTFAQDLEGRRLAATDDPAADAYRRALEHERELQRAIADGIDEAGLAQLRYIQGLEDEKVARDAMLDQQKRTLELLRDEARAQDDLNARKLRAQGLDAAADELALLARQRQELEDAQGKGFSAGFVADLLSTQALERDAFAEERRRRQQEAFDRAASSAFGLTTSYAESSGRVDLAIGASESTVNRLAGLNTSMLGVQQRFLPFLESLDRRLARLEALLAQRAGLSPGDLDDALGLAVLRAEQAQGLAPTN